MPLRIKIAQKPQRNHPQLNVWVMSLDAGLKIAAPLVICELIGIKLDKTYGTTPFFIISALIFSFFVSTVILFRDVKRLNSQNDSSKKDA
jgi:F0F1-type ATP synthase assembly protein I